MIERTAISDAYIRQNLTEPAYFLIITVIMLRDK